MITIGNVLGNYAKGRWIHLASLPLGTDNLVVVLLKSSGLPTDATIKDCQYLSQIISAGATEATFTNYARKVLSAPSIFIVVNTGTDVVSLDTSDQTWNSAGGASNDTLGAFLLCYRPTSGSADSAIWLLTKHDYSQTTNGGNLVASVPSIGTST